MPGLTPRRLGAFALAVGLASLFSFTIQAAEPGATTAPVRIGLVNSLFRDVPEETVLGMMEPIGALMQAQTGVSGRLLPAGNAASLGRQLAEDKVQLGVFHGFEFAWARQKHPELRPLVIAVNQSHHLRALLVVRQDSRAACLADLRDKPFGLPRFSRAHCHLYLQRRCQECGKEPQALFGKITTPANVEEALDDVVDDLIHASVVDGVALEGYQRRKPGRYAKLKTVQVSEVFPAAVVAYRAGAVDEATLRKFREGLLGAQRTVLGRQMLLLWKLTGFEPVPEDYEQTLADIVKAYPPPGQ
jgi:ABC-type phosphate/phosphonate transport system substrate-binding protein